LLHLHPLLLLLLAILFLGCKRPRIPFSPITSPDYKKGEQFFKTQQDSAFYYFNKVATNPGDSLQVAKAYAYMAIIQSDAGDLFGSQESLLQALKFLNEKKDSDRHTLSSVYNELGVTSANLRNYETAIGYYDSSIKFSKDSFKIVPLNNKALTYQKLLKYDQTLAIFYSIIDKSREHPIEYARILTNMAYTKWLQHPDYNAAPEFQTALQIRKSEKDDWGLNSSYAHLSDYYTRTHPDSALHYAGKMYAMAQQLNSPNDELLALQKLIPLSPPEVLKKYFIRYRYLIDSLQTSRNNAKNQFALIRYEIEKSKADNLVLQKANAEKKVQIIWQWILLMGVLALTVIGFGWYRKQKQRAFREQQLKTSKKVHDVVANGLYHVISKVDHDKTGGKEQLLDDLTSLYEQSRNISYEQPEEKKQLPFNESLARLLSSFSSDNTRVLIVGNSQELWSTVKPGIKKELNQILQELMVNMRKHSRAQNVVVRFQMEHKTLTVQYTDDGVGAPPGFRWGNGLRNTENRIAGMGGRVSFDTETSEGMKIQLYIPTA